MVGGTGWRRRRDRRLELQAERADQAFEAALAAEARAAQAGDAAAAERARRRQAELRRLDRRQKLLTASRKLAPLALLAQGAAVCAFFIGISNAATHRSLAFVPQEPGGARPAAPSPFSVSGFVDLVGGGFAAPGAGGPPSLTAFGEEDDDLAGILAPPRAGGPEPLGVYRPAGSAPHHGEVRKQSKNRHGDEERTRAPALQFSGMPI